MLFLEIIGSIAACGATYFCAKTMASKLDRRKRRKLVEAHVLAIVDKRASGIIEKLSDAVAPSCITLDTMARIHENVQGLIAGDAQEIHVVLHTRGGQATAAESIAKTILDARAHGIRVCAYIPYYAFSGGCLIALACDEIFMTASSIIGPTDGQMQDGGSSVSSVKAICETVEWQKKHATNKVKAEWYAKYVDAKSCRVRQREFMDDLIKRGFYTQELGDSIYEELFSGKYNHDQGFDHIWASEKGLSVTRLEKMPDFAEQAISVYRGKDNE